MVRDARRESKLSFSLEIIDKIWTYFMLLLSTTRVFVKLFSNEVD